MGRTVIFYDGEYVRKIFDTAGHRIDVPKTVTQMLEMTKTDENNLLRVYYYTSPPYQSQNPTPAQKERYQNWQKFEAYLKRQDNFEIRLGRTERRGNTFEQKMVDVHLSIDLVDLSATGKIDTAILVAGDSDFAPAVKKSKNRGVRVILCCSSNPKEYHRELWNVADRRILMDQQFMQDCCYQP